MLSSIVAWNLRTLSSTWTNPISPSIPTQKHKSNRQKWFIHRHVQPKSNTIAAHFCMEALTERSQIPSTIGNKHRLDLVITIRRLKSLNPRRWAIFGPSRHPRARRLRSTLPSSSPDLASIIQIKTPSRYASWRTSSKTSSKMRRRRCPGTSACCSTRLVSGRLKNSTWTKRKSTLSSRRLSNP